MAMRKRRQTKTEIIPVPEHYYHYPWVRLRSGTSHMFVYQRMVAEVDPAARAGDIVAVYDKKNQFFGHGFYHDKSQIALRMLSYEPREVDEHFLLERLTQAVEWRHQLFSGDIATNVYRLVHSEGDQLSGLIAERYADCIAIEIFSLGIYKRLDLFKRLLRLLTGIDKFVVRADERIEKIEGFQVARSQSDDVQSVTIRENDIRFRVDLRRGHKTGFFCDQRENRKHLAPLCSGKEVLDACCYTGGFSLYAKKLGHAQSVTGVDLDEEAIELAKKNAHLNEVRINFVHADAFSYLRQMQENGRTYDLVVVDPSKFVAGKRDFHEGSKKYVDLNTLAISLVKPGGILLTCSCSGIVSQEQFIGMVKSAANRQRRRLQIFDQTGAGPDHPVMRIDPITVLPRW